MVDKNKRMESLVDRFCCKFSVDENERLNTNIAYCLSLVTYNEKALRKLQFNFSMYKHQVHNKEIYEFFTAILSECVKIKVGKVDLKPIATEIEQAIASVFDLNENGEAPPTKPAMAKKTKLTTTARQKKKTQKNRSESEEEEEEARTRSRKTKKTGGKRRKVVARNRSESSLSSD